jgi:hypothetical protein
MIRVPLAVGVGIRKENDGKIREKVVYENRLNAKETLLAGFGKHCLR